MKKILYSFFILTCFIVNTYTAQNLSTNVFARTCIFNSPQGGPYTETYITIPGKSIKYIPVAGKKFQASVEIDILILDGSTVANFDKYILKSPEVVDTNTITFSIVETKRLAIPNKAVSLELTITDINNRSNTVSSTESLIPAFTDKIEVSDIQFVDAYKTAGQQNNFTKNGYELTPYAVDFFPTNRSTIILYGEVYNTDKQIPGEQFLTTFSIRNAATNDINKQYFQYEKFDDAPVVSFLREFNITDLPSGNYNLVIEVKNTKNELLAQKKIFFQRANSNAVVSVDNIAMVNTSGTFVESYSDEQLNYFLDILRPRATSDETYLIESLSPRTDSDMKKKFLLNFWTKRNQSDPYKEWTQYLELVRQVNTNFGVPGKAGYKTDRGRVYLQYGPPNDIVTSVNEAGAFPYEIWFYNTLPDKQTNIGFAFYEPSMVSNDYVLLHSNARGELHDQRWKVKIYENIASPQELNDFDNTDVKSKTGANKAIDAYNF